MCGSLSGKILGFQPDHQRTNPMSSVLPKPNPKPKTKVVLERGSRMLSVADAKLSNEIAEELWGLSIVKSDDKSITYETEQLNSEYDTDRFWGCVRLACAGVRIEL